MTSKSKMLLRWHQIIGASLTLALLFLSGCSSLNPASIHNTASLEPAPIQVQPAKERPPRTHYQSALAEIKAGNMDMASREVKLALQENPLDASSHFLLGCLLEREGEHDQAIVAFQQAVALDPANPDALYNLGTMLLWRGELVPASRMLENAVLARPDHVPSHNNLGKAYFLSRLPELAIAAYEEALRLDPSNAIALNNLLLLAEATGNNDAATSYRRRLEAIGSDRTENSSLIAGEPITQLPVWPLGVAAVGTSSPTPLPAIDTMAPSSPPDQEADALREIIRDLPHVKVERRGGRLTLTGYTSGPKERAMLDRIIGIPAPTSQATPPAKPVGTGGAAILDLTSDDSGDPQRMVEFDSVLFMTTELDQRDIGFNFLELIDLNFNYFNSKGTRAGVHTANFSGLAFEPLKEGWIFSAAASYSVNIANAADERVAVLARPHLTALSGTAASFLAGGELIFRVSGNISGDIRPYPFGTTLKVTPTLLRTPAEDGTPRIHVKVEAGRLSVLTILEQSQDAPSTFSKILVTSEAVINLDQTLILSGLSQRESHTGVSGVPILRDIPILKYLFSTRSTTVSDLAVIILLTPRDPAFAGERNRIALEEYINMRRAFIKAKQDALRICSTFKNATRTGKIKYPTVSPHTSLC